MTSIRASLNFKNSLPLLVYQDVEAGSEIGAVEARSLLGFFLKNPGRLIPLGKKYKLLKMPFHTVENLKLSSPKANGEKKEFQQRLFANPVQTHLAGDSTSEYFKVLLM